MTRMLCWLLAIALAFMVGACATASLSPSATPQPTTSSTRHVEPTSTPTATPTPTPWPTPVGFLTREGTDLILEGEPLYEISFNKFDLFFQYVLEGSQHEGQDGIPAAREALQALGSRGFRVIRVIGSPFSPAGFNFYFFDDDPQRQEQKRQQFFERFDRMLDACDEHGIRVVLSLLWNIENIGDLGHHSLRDGLTDPQSTGRQKAEEYVRAVVSRYRDRTTIAMWEIGNEYNLLADLQFPNGPFPGSTEGDGAHPGPVVRDQSNNFTSDDLALFIEDIAGLIRSLDDNHLITTGNSAPRPAAMHLLRAARRQDPVDWTFDSRGELIEYLKLTHPDPVDVISIHYSDDSMVSLGGTIGSPDNLHFFVEAAREIGKPLFIGEIGYHSGFDRYDEPLALDTLRATLPVLIEVKIPLTLYWAFSDDRTGAKQEGIYSLRYGETDEALELIEAANAIIDQ